MQHVFHNKTVCNLEEILMELAQNDRKKLIFNKTKASYLCKI